MGQGIEPVAGSTCCHGSDGAARLLTMRVVPGENLILRRALSRQRTCAVRCVRLEGCATYPLILATWPDPSYDLRLNFRQLNVTKINER